MLHFTPFYVSELAISKSIEHGHRLRYILVRNAMQRILRYFIVFLSFFLSFFFCIVE